MILVPPPWATGLAMRSDRLILVTLTATDDARVTDAEDIFLHEVVHIAEWDAAGGNKTPIWFSEGLAIHVSGEFSFERSKVLVEAAIRNKLLPLSELSDKYPGDGRRVNVAYAQSADLVGWLEENYGPGFLSALLWRVRKGDEFGRSVNNALVGLILDRSIDTNDRLAQQTTLIAPSGDEVINGQTFRVSDGVHSVTFEYEDPAVGDGVQAGNVEIRFKSWDPNTSLYVADPDHVIACRIRDAINSPQVQTLLNIRAAKSDDAIQLIPSREMTLEFAIEFIEDDELVEVTPKHIRLRKKYLTENERRIAKKQPIRSV